MTSNCCKISAFLLLFCRIGIPQCLADVVAISGSEQESVSGWAMACDPGCQMLYNVYTTGQVFSSAKTSPGVPSGSLGVSGSAIDSFTTPFNYVRTASVDAFAGQLNNLTPTEIDLDLSESADLAGNDNLMTAGANANNQYNLVFDLTTPSVVHLVGGMTDQFDLFSYLGFVSPSFDGEIHLTGPGFQFDQFLSSSPFDALFTLGPGQYTLEGFAGLEIDQTYFVGSYSELDVSLTADFTSIPEPSGTSTVLGISMLAGLCFARKGRVKSIKGLAIARSDRR